MTPAQIANSTRTIGASQGHQGLPLRDEPGTTPVMVSEWRPDLDERMRIANGGSVFLHVIGTAHPPVVVVA